MPLEWAASFFPSTSRICSEEGRGSWELVVGSAQQSEAPLWAGLREAPLRFLPRGGHPAPVPFGEPASCLPVPPAPAGHTGASPPKVLGEGVGACSLPLLSDALSSATLEAALLPFPFPLLPPPSPSTSSSPSCWCPRCHLGLETLLRVPGSARVKPGSIHHPVRASPGAAVRFQWRRWCPGEQAPWGEGKAAPGQGGGGQGPGPGHLFSLHMHLRGNGLAWAPGSVRSKTEATPLAQRRRAAGCRAVPSSRPQGRRSALGN